MEDRVVDEWLPDGKVGAVVFTVDDVHPGTSEDAYEAGGDLGRGALGQLAELLDRNPRLAMTLFVTPDWREVSPVPTRRMLARVPGLRDRLFLAPVLPRGTMRLDRHPGFVSYVRGLPRTDVALHGLEHIHRGPRIPIEFQDEARSECRDKLLRAMDIFQRAGLPYSLGLQPPGWNLPPALAEACRDVGLHWVCSARDVLTEPAADARTAMSGLRGVSLIHPTVLPEGLVHITNNFQATSRIERATAIIEGGGVLAVKAHIVKNALGHLALDGVDPAYCNYLDLLFAELDRCYGESLLWTTVEDIASRVRHLEGDELSSARAGATVD